VADALDWIRGKANEALYFEKEVPLRSGGVYVDPRNGSQATISGDGKYLKWTDSKYGNPLNGGYGAFR
jgi:hypothetical protein